MQDFRPSSYKNFEFRFEIACDIPKEKVNFIRFPITKKRDVVMDLLLRSKPKTSCMQAIRTLELYLEEPMDQTYLNTILETSPRSIDYRLYSFSTWEIEEEEGRSFPSVYSIDQTSVQKNFSAWPRALGINTLCRIVGTKITIEDEVKILEIFLDTSYNRNYGLVMSTEFIHFVFAKHIESGRRCRNEILHNINFPIPTLEEMRTFMIFQNDMKDRINTKQYYLSIRDYMRKSFVINAILRQKLIYSNQEPAKLYDTFLESYPETEFTQFYSDLKNAKNLNRMFDELSPMPFGITVYRTLSFEQDIENMFKLKDDALISTSLVPCGFELDPSTFTKIVILKINIPAGTRVFFPLSFSISKYYKTLLRTAKQHYNENEFLYGSDELEVLCQPGSHIKIIGRPFIIHGSQLDAYVYNADLMPPSDSDYTYEILPPKLKRKGKI